MVHRHSQCSSQTLAHLTLCLAVLIAAGLWLAGPPPVAANGGPWHFEHPLPQGNTLRGLWGTGPGYVIAVGDAGTTLRWNGSQWSLMPNATTAYLNAIWGSGESDIYAVGEKGTILHYDGYAWSQQSSGTASNLNGVWGAGATVFAVGDGGVILKNAGSGWTALASGTTDILSGVWGSSATDVFAVGQQGVVVHTANGADWNVMTQGTYTWLTAVWGAGPNDVYVAGELGVLLHYDGATWSSPIPTPAGVELLYGLTGLAGGDIYAVGAHGTVVRSGDGLNWSDASPGGGETLLAVWGVHSPGGDELFAVGDYGTTYRYGSSGWSRTGDGMLEDQQAIWGNSANDVYSVGNGGSILHFDGSTWRSEISNTDASLRGVWGSGSTVFAVGGGGAVVRREPGAWSAMDSGTPETLSAVWGTSPANVFAVGTGGAIVHYDGSTWSPMVLPGGWAGILDAVWGSSAADVWAVGQANAVFRYDGNQWAAMAPLEGEFSDSWTGVWGSGPDDVWLSGWFGTIQHWDGATWTGYRDSGLTWSLLNQIWSNASGEAFVVGGEGRILRYSAGAWGYMPSPVRWEGVEFYDLRGIWGDTATGDVFAAGTGGIVLHLPPPAPPSACGGAFTAGADVTVYEGTPSQARGSEPVLAVGNQAGQNALTLVSFPLGDSHSPDNEISSAWLELRLASAPSPAAFTVQAWRASSDWSETAATWNGRPTPQRLMAEQTFETPYDAADPGLVRLDVTNWALLWNSQEITRTDLMLTVPGSPASSLNLFSREYGAGSAAPRLVIECRRRPAALPADPAANARQLVGLDRLRLASLEAPAISFRSGDIRSASFRIPVPAEAGSTALDRAIWFMRTYSDTLRVDNTTSAAGTAAGPANQPRAPLDAIRRYDFQVIRRSDAGDSIFFRQLYQGIPVFAAELGVRLDGAAVVGLSGAYLPDIQLDPQWRHPAERAEQLALLVSAPGSRKIGETQLRVFDWRILGLDRDPRTGRQRSHLAWEVPLTANGGQSIFVDAHTGAILFKKQRAYSSFNLSLNTGNHAGPMNCAEWLFSTSDTEWGNENGVYHQSADQAARDAFSYVRNTYDLYKGLGRDSTDNHGKQIDMYIHVGDNWRNARYMWGCDIMEFGEGQASQDVVAHEFSHGVTGFTSNLTYALEPGALNESFSDIFGYFSDPGDWQIGEDTPGGASRDMSDPPLAGDPDEYKERRQLPSVTDPECDRENPKYNDCGWVHKNSGINNKAAYLIIAGGNFNQRDMGAGIGREKAKRLFYQAFTGLSSNAQMIDARDMMVDLARRYALDYHGMNGFTQQDYCVVKNAYAAVGLGTGDQDCDLIDDNVDADADNDGRPDHSDNCRYIFNPDQANVDRDMWGDACDDDIDQDGRRNSVDNCPFVINWDQRDADMDGLGDACDDNVDGDGIADAVDNCPLTNNPDQADTDRDGVGDACDLDDDNDGRWDNNDNCQFVANPQQQNADDDMYGDACDLCRTLSADDNRDPDGDGLANPCDPDDDGDGVRDDGDGSGVAGDHTCSTGQNGNCDDNCRITRNPDQADWNRNGVGNACDATESGWAAIGSHRLDLQLRPGEVLRVPTVNYCTMCAGGIPDPGYNQVINLSLNYGVYAQIVDSSGQVMARGEPAQAGDLAHQTLTWYPAADAFTGATAFQAQSTTALSYLGAGVFGGTAGAAAPAPVQAAGRTHYWLELYPLEGAGPNQGYTGTIEYVEGGPHHIFLPLLRR